jgi:hypothetical protein
MHCCSAFAPVQAYFLRPHRIGTVTRSVSDMDDRDNSPLGEIKLSFAI